MKNMKHVALVSELQPNHPLRRKGLYLASALGCIAYGESLIKALEGLTKELKENQGPMGVREGAVGLFEDKAVAAIAEIRTSRL